MKPEPLIVIGITHPNCWYKWICLEKPTNEYYNSPVLYVNEPHIYKCSVAISEQEKYEVVFDVSFVPMEGWLVTLQLAQYALIFTDTHDPEEEQTSGVELTTTSIS